MSDPKQPKPASEPDIAGGWSQFYPGSPAPGARPPSPPPAAPAAPAGPAGTALRPQPFLPPGARSASSVAPQPFIPPGIAPPEQEAPAGPRPIPAAAPDPGVPDARETAPGSYSPGAFHAGGAPSAGAPGGYAAGTFAGGGGAPVAVAPGGTALMTGAPTGAGGAQWSEPDRGAGPRGGWQEPTRPTGVHPAPVGGMNDSHAYRPEGEFSAFDPAGAAGGPRAGAVSGGAPPFGAPDPMAGPPHVGTFVGAMPTGGAFDSRGTVVGGGGSGFDRGPGGGGFPPDPGPDGRGPERARLFLRGNAEAWKGSPWLGMLVRLLRLDVYGTANLTRRAAYAMELGAVILAIIFVFDLSLWFVLLNLIFNRGGAAVSAAGGFSLADGLVSLTPISPLALMLALCLTTASIVFEASIFTADLSKLKEKGGIVRQWPTLLSMVGRVALVIVAATITAEPLHVMIFDGPIQNRWQEEVAIRKAVHVATQIVAEGKQVTKIGDGKQYLIEQQQKETDTAARRASTAEADLLQAEAERQRVDKQISSDSSILGRGTCWDGVGVKPDTNATRCSFFSKRIADNRAKLKDLDARISRAKAEAKQSNQEKKGAKKEQDRTEEAAAACLDLAGNDKAAFTKALPLYAQKLKEAESARAFTFGECISQTRSSDESSAQSCAELAPLISENFAALRTTAKADADADLAKLPEDAKAVSARLQCALDLLNMKESRCRDWCFEMPKADFHKRREIIDDLIAGREPRWPDAAYSAADCQLIVGDMKFTPPSSGTCKSFRPPPDAAPTMSKGDEAALERVVATVDRSGTTAGAAANVNALGAKVGEPLTCTPYFLMTPGAISPTTKAQVAFFEYRWLVNGTQTLPVPPVTVSAPNADGSVAPLTLDTTDAAPGSIVTCEVTPYSASGAPLRSMASNPVELVAPPPRAAAASPQADDGTCAGCNPQRVADGKHLGFMYWLVTLIGMFVPLVSLLYKLVAPREMSDYYSLEWQAAAKHPEAMRQREAELRRTRAGG